MRLPWTLSFLLLIAGICSSANAQTCGALRPNESLAPDQSIRSCNGIGTFVHQSDGNVVLYDGTVALWASNTQGATSALWMQGDGNLVLYSANGTPLWHTGTNGSPGAWLAIQDDCNLVIYGPAGNALWASGTSCRTNTPPPTASWGVKNKMIAGYQGWFSAPGDGSVDDWVHWGPGTVSPGRVTFELYPDVREYQAVFQTGLANLGNGSPARLFSSFTNDTVQVHFRWMREHNIDGAALQRFMDDRTEMRNSIAAKVRSAAEANGRSFYVMYDVSGMNDADFVQRIQGDWTNTIVNSLQLTASPNYARENGKIVVSLWGIGFPDRPGTAQAWTNLINWFKAQNVYVIGGVPWAWRTGEGVKPNFLNVYTQLNMLSPWTVGLYSTDADVDAHRTGRLIPDRDYLAARGIDYQPVAYPGFAWSNWMAGAPRNQIPRRRGGLFWRQAYDLKQSNISTMYVAMFDEYDEGTAIAKAAESSAMVPTNQYFLALDADGTALSSDFYLRLANAANRMLKGETAPTPTVPISNF